jgi:aminomethyltransferase
MDDGGLVRTALYEKHVEAGAKIVNFHGFELPIWYTSIQDEHLSCRKKSGLFDVSHMGLFEFQGEEVLSWLNSIGTQQYMNFTKGQCGYTHFLDNDGNIIDDMIFAVDSKSRVLGVPNASMISTMWNWFNSNLPADGSVTIADLSDNTSIIALQGPESSLILEEVLGGENVVSRFRCQEISVNDLGITGWIQGTGYTGEKGVEIFVPDDQAANLWDSLINSGAIPVGLGARDTLRLEKGYLLSGQDFLWPGLGLDPGVELPEGFLARNSAETNVPFGLNLNHDFIGKESVLESIDFGSKWQGLLCQEKGPSPRPGHLVLDGPTDNASIVGYVTSGGPSPSLNRTGIALGYLDDVVLGQELWIQTSSRRRIRSIVVQPPFV